MKFLKTFLTLITLPLLVVITMVNTEYIFQNNISQIYVLIYVAYFVFSAVGLLIFRRFTFKNVFIKQERLSTLQFLFHICILFLPAAILTHYFILGTLGGTGLYLRSYGKIAFLYLVLALSISPLITFIKNTKISDTLILLRKSMGILSFIFFLKHGLEYFSMEYLFAIKHSPAIGYRNYVWQNFIIRRDASTGVVAGILLFFLGITSNRFSVKLLSGSVWKKVQSLVYPAFLVASIHVAFASRFDVFYILLVVRLVAIRSASYLAKKDKPTSGPTTKYVCIPCGYIYDEAVGDPDGGLEPGTKFEDIPDSRVCPICGVTKSSFEPYYEAPHAVFSGYIGQIIGYLMLTKDVLEVTLKTSSPLTVSPGQYILVTLKDFDGEFTRAYSIVENVGDTIKLGIKVQDTGRGGRALKKMKIGDTLKIKGVYGNFVLKNTPSPKIFIATGTGFSPMYNMLLHNTFSKDNTLLRGFSTKEDMYYMDKLKAFKNLKVEIFLSKEQVEGYHYGRMDTGVYDFSPDTEFYVCGVPAMVTEQVKLLKARGYKNVYAEAF